MKSIWSYTTCAILPSKINNKTEFLLSIKPVPSPFLNYFCSVSVAFALKESSSKRRAVVLLKESVQISPGDFVCEREAS